MQQIFPQISDLLSQTKSGKWHNIPSWPSWTLLLAICIVALPTIYQFANFFWTKPDDSHAPLVLCGVLFGFWQERANFNWQTKRVVAGFALSLAMIGTATYVLGRSQDFYQLEGLGLVLFVWSCLLLVTDLRAMRRILLLALLCVFIIPVPATLMDQALLPLKLSLTNLVVTLFYDLGYPIASHGVLISVSFYQLQIADACAGLRSLLALAAIGLLYVYFVPSRTQSINIALIVLIPFIAVLTNFCRLSLLVLLTYYFGGDFSERTHGLAGLGEIVVALLLFIGTHKVLDQLTIMRKS